MQVLDTMVGTRGACILDEKLEVLGKVPLTELETTLSNMPTPYAVVLDGVIDNNLVGVSSRAGVVALVGMESRVNPSSTGVVILTLKEKVQ